MSKQAKWKALWIAAEVLLGVVVAILIVVYFEEPLTRINWGLVALLCGAGAVVVAIYRWQMRADNQYDVLDMVTKDGRADLDKHLTVLSFALAVWLIVQQALAKQPVTELMLGVLAFFVVKRGADGFSEALKRRPPPVEQSQNVNVLPGAKVQPASEEISQYRG